MRGFLGVVSAAVLGTCAVGGFAQSAPRTADQDHQNMMDQLGIKALRPGPSGDEKAPNHANYDESLANPYPNLPDPLTLNDGQKVAIAKVWWEERRPQLVTMFEDEVYGHVPANVPKVTWTVRASTTSMSESILWLQRISWGWWTTRATRRLACICT